LQRDVRDFCLGRWNFLELNIERRANAERLRRKRGSIIIRIKTGLAIQSVLSQLRKAFPSDGHFFKLCAIMWRRRLADEQTCFPTRALHRGTALSIV
jgi:hypothetical protein